MARERHGVEETLCGREILRERHGEGEPMARERLDEGEAW